MLLSIVIGVIALGVLFVGIYATGEWVKDKLYRMPLEARISFAAYLYAYLAISGLAFAPIGAGLAFLTKPAF
jgi:hypothetical protein